MRISQAHRRSVLFLVALVLFAVAGLRAVAQSTVEREHRRGKLWEVVRNDGWIGSQGAWDFGVLQALGMYPGFDGYLYPCCDENQAVNTYENANFHDFRSGCWIVVKDMTIPGGPPAYAPEAASYEVYSSGLQEGAYGVASVLEPLALMKNYSETPGFDPLLPEEMTDGFWYTNTGIRVTRRSYVWSFPGYSDFIIYDYVFKNTGEYISTVTKRLLENPADVLKNQTLRNVRFVFHSGISVSTKSPINFHCEVYAIMAGGFGWQPATYHDYYHRVDDDNLLFSTNFNGGARPHPNAYAYCTKPDSVWQTKFGKELFSPAAFGWLALYADPLPGQPPRSSAKPDVLRIDSHKGGKFGGQPLDLEYFRGWGTSSKQKPYDFASTPDTQAALGNQGNRFNFYTLSYGPYTLAPGDSVRIILAEIAGVMDYSEVNAGDPDRHFPDSSIAAIRRNADHARKAVLWGRGATVGGIPLAADVPEPPPAPGADAVNASVGSIRAAIAVTWDHAAETAQLTDGAGALFYDGLSSLDGYRVYRSADFQYTTESQPPVFRGAAWELVADIPKSEFSAYADPEDPARYRYVDSTVSFGSKYGYYVSAYRSSVPSWTSANGTTVTDLGMLESGDVRHTAAVTPLAGPIAPDDPSFFDIFVVPNPFDASDPARHFTTGASTDNRVEFRNLPERATIRIYSIMGDLLATIEHGPDSRGNLTGTTSWNLITESGIPVAPGVYVYHIECKVPGVEREITGKLMIIR